MSVSCALLLVFFVALRITVMGTFFEVSLKNPGKPAKQLSSSPEVFKSSYEPTIQSTFNIEEDPLNSVLYFDDVKEIRRDKKDSKVWDHWGKWSACSVSCGVGKMTRWRHCLSQSCRPGEKEAQIKTCNLNPCS